MPRYLIDEDNGPPSTFSAKNNKEAVKYLKKHAQSTMLSSSLYKLVEDYEPVFEEDPEDEEVD